MNFTSMGGRWGRMNPQEIIWLQHAVLVIKGEKCVVIVTGVSASVKVWGK